MSDIARIQEDDARAKLRPEGEIMRVWKGVRLHKMWFDRMVEWYGLPAADQGFPSV